MKLNFSSYGENYNGYLKAAKYYNGNLAIMVNLEDGEPYGTLTVNICDLPENEAAIDTNNFPDAEEIINKYHLGENTGKTLQSGYCTYPVYAFDMKEVSKYAITQ